MERYGLPFGIPGQTLQQHTQSWQNFKQHHTQVSGTSAGVAGPPGARWNSHIGWRAALELDPSFFTHTSSNISQQDHTNIQKNKFTKIAFEEDSSTQR